MNVRIDFSKVKGQDSAKKILSRAVKSDEYPPLYLFAGPRGVGKATMAVEFAKAANCVNEVQRPCGKCDQCRKISRFIHPDIHFLLPDKPEGLRQKMGNSGGIRPNEFDYTKDISIRQVRDIQYELFRPPVEAKHRFVIVLNGENLTLEAQNAFLKTLEEPPPNTTFILVSDNPDLILPTIRSRARVVKFGNLKFQEFSYFFSDSPVSPLVLYRLANGSVGKAKEMLDWGVFSLRRRILDILESGEIADMLQLIEELRVERQLVGKFVEIYLVLIRDVLLSKLGLSNLITNIDMHEEIGRVGQKIHWKVIEEIFDALRRSEIGLKRNTNTQLILHAVFKPVFRYRELLAI